MKLPNGFGTVYKLSGKNRRKPFVAKKTKGWEIDEVSGKAKQLYIVIGYYATRKEALTALAEFNANPYDIDLSRFTFEDVYTRWSDEHYPTVSESNVKGYRAAWALCEKIKKMRFVDVNLYHLQAVVDESGKNEPTLRKLKVLLGMMYKYAVIHEVVSKERNLVEYLDISKAGNPNAHAHTRFTKEEVNRIWEVKDSNIYYSVLLMRIYAGCRIGEFLDLKKENVHLDEKYFEIIASKTNAGLRIVPIADKVFPFFEYWYNLNSCDYLITTPEGEHFTYSNYRGSYWNPLMDTIGMEHRPHDTRHTCISLLTVAKVSDKIIRKIVGHKGQGVTEQVYTHFEIDELLDAINKI